MKQSQGDIQIYVACLAAYNNGILHGCWINAEQDAYDTRDAGLSREAFEALRTGRMPEPRIARDPQNATSGT